MESLQARIVCNRREIQLTRPAITYALETVLYLNKKYMSDVQLPCTITYSEYFLYRWSTSAKHV